MKTILLAAAVLVGGSALAHACASYWVYGPPGSKPLFCTQCGGVVTCV